MKAAAQGKKKDIQKQSLPKMLVVSFAFIKNLYFIQFVVQKKCGKFW